MIPDQAGRGGDIHNSNLSTPSKDPETKSKGLPFLTLLTLADGAGFAFLAFSFFGPSAAARFSACGLC